MKPTLLIPCCGRLAYAGIPAYIAYRPSGEILLSRALAGMDLEQYERVVVIIPAEHVRLFNAEEKIRLAITFPRLDIVALEEETSGPAMTIYIALERLDIHGPIVVKDADNYIKWMPNPKATNFMVGIDIYDYSGEIRELKNKCFLLANEQNQLLDVVEKRICSPNVGLGVYGFDSADHFKEAYISLCEPIYGLKNLYVSEIIAYLMGLKGSLFEYIAAEDYVNWGNPYDLDNLMKNPSWFAEQKHE